MANTTTKIKEFFTAKYLNVNWKAFGENDGLMCIEDQNHEAISNFIDEFKEWESAGFPELDTFLSEPNGCIRYKKIN